jgi:adenylylsulfate kinase
MFILFTGLSGAGKSTLADKLNQKLIQNGVKSYVLDGDVLRKGINNRRENLRRMAEISKLFLQTGTVVSAAFIAPYETSRELIKTIVGARNYIEVFVNTSLETCKKRDVKGLYKKAGNNEIKNFTGVNAPYEVPQKPTLEINESQNIETAVEIVFSLIMNKI